jgi:hypothetical protein
MTQEDHMRFCFSVFAKELFGSEHNQFRTSRKIDQLNETGTMLHDTQKEMLT